MNNGFSLPEQDSLPEGLQAGFIEDNRGSEMNRVENSIAQFLNSSLSNAVKEMLPSHFQQHQHSNQEGEVVAGMVEGTKSNYDQDWKPNNRVHGQNQAIDMMQVKDLISNVKECSELLVLELGKFPGSSLVVETSRSELEETCKRLLQSLGISEVPNKVKESNGSQNLQWLVEFWKIKYEEIAKKYTRLVGAVKMKIVADAQITPYKQHNATQNYQDNTQLQVKQQQSDTYNQKNYAAGNTPSQRQLAQESAGQNPYTQQNTAGEQVHDNNFYTQGGGFLQSQISLSPRPVYSTANTPSIGPTPPESPHSAHPVKDLPPDSAILFVESAPQVPKVNVIRCDRVRPVPVKDRGVKVQSIDKDGKSSGTLDQIASSPQQTFVEEQNILVTEEQAQFSNEGNTGSINQNGLLQKMETTQTQTKNDQKQNNKGSKKRNQGGNKSSKRGGSDKNENGDQNQGGSEAGSVGVRGGKRYYRKGGKNKGKGGNVNPASNHNSNIINS